MGFDPRQVTCIGEIYVCHSAFMGDRHYRRTVALMKQYPTDNL